MENFIFTVIILFIVGSAVRYILKHRKKGVKCIGCPYASSCMSGCHDEARTEKQLLLSDFSE